MSFVVFMAIAAIAVRAQDTVVYQKTEAVNKEKHVDSLEMLLLEGEYGSGVNVIAVRLSPNYLIFSI